MKISESAIATLKALEGFRSSAYYCSGGKITIGYGTTNADAALIGIRITKKSACSKAQADRWLRMVCEKKYGRAVEKYNGVYRWTQAEFDALVIFAYNIGGIDQLTANGTRTKAQIADKMLEYCKAAGTANSGLLARRKTERRMFLAGAKEEAHDMDTLKNGAKGQQVRCLQMILYYKYGHRLAYDGIFGAATDAAVKAVQQSYGLTPDGIVGAKTWEKLLG